MKARKRDIVEIDAIFLHTNRLSLPAEDEDKETRGRVVIVGGSERVPGAPILSGLGALRAGAGKVILAVPEALAIATGIAFPEVGVIGFTDMPRGVVERGDAVLVGPGLMDESAARELTLRLLAESEEPTFVLDAVALTGLGDAQAAFAPHHGRIILTPHAGEMAALTGLSKEAVQRDPVPVACEMAERLNCTVVLKGATTHIVSAEGPLYRHSGAAVGLATSGSGDVLAGIIAALLARGASITQACAWGVYAHAQAGVRLASRMGTLGLIAREIANEVPYVFMTSEIIERSST